MRKSQSHIKRMRRSHTRNIRIQDRAGITTPRSPLQNLANQLPGKRLSPICRLNKQSLDFTSSLRLASCMTIRDTARRLSIDRCSQQLPIPPRIEARKAPYLLLKLYEVALVGARGGDEELRVRMKEKLGLLTCDESGSKPRIASIRNDKGKANGLTPAERHG